MLVSFGNDRLNKLMKKKKENRINPINKFFTKIF